MPCPPFDPDEIFAALQAHKVRFIVIGGIAAILHGDSGVTVDVDITPSPDPDNLRRLAAALRSLNARIRTAGVDEGLPFDVSPEFLTSLGPDGILNLRTRAGDLDVAFCPTGTAGLDDLARDAVSIESPSGVPLLVAALHDIIRSKRAANRPRDRQALPRLQALLARTSRSTASSSPSAT